jgi:parvulin-like peptidyl-prolyl isomerase
MFEGKRRRAACSIGIIFICVLFCSTAVQGQEIVDRMVASVNGGVRNDLITYSDLLWQLALQPGTPLANPRSEDLNSALQSLINQRLILQEAEKLPAIAPSDEDVRAAIADLVKRFPSSAEFVERLRKVGFVSIDDEQFKEIIRRRLVIENYLNFRFRSFTVVTPEEEASYYTKVFVPRFKSRSPDAIVPTLEDVRAQINRRLTESKIESETDAFLDSARESAEIIILSPV